MDFKDIYNKIGSKYDDRYAHDSMHAISELINKQVNLNCYKTIAEIACGTGHWLTNISYQITNKFGFDLSLSFLKAAQNKNSKLMLCCCDAFNLPVKNNTFDYVFVINAIHMFPDKEKFLRDLKGIMKRCASILIVTIDPFDVEFQMYTYDFFDGIKSFDQKRFIKRQEIVQIVNDLEFSDVTCKPIFNTSKEFINEKVFTDIFLEKHNSSQLAWLNYEEYNKGIDRIKKTIEYAKKRQADYTFRVDLTFYAISAFLK